MKMLGIDHGAKRVGVAVSDPGESLLSRLKRYPEKIASSFCLAFKSWFWSTK